MIDMGGTPAKLTEKDRILIALANNIPQDKIVAILDPFDLSRDQRKMELGNYKIKAIKFPIEVPNGQTNLSSEFIKPPKPEDCARLLESAENPVIGKIQSIYGRKIDIKAIKAKYSYLKQKIEKLARESKNLRDFMNDLLGILKPNLKTIKLEKVLSSNISLIYQILEKINIPVRAICPRCNRFVEMFLRENTPCCKVSNKEIIESGKYIPQQGYLGVIIYFFGYYNCINIDNPDTESRIKKAEEILAILGKKENPIITYKEPEEKKTMFEAFLLEETLLNPKNITKSEKKEEK